MKKIIILMIGMHALCFISCKNKEASYVNNEFADTIVITPNMIKESVPISELFCKVKFVPLETTDDCLIGEIDKLLIHNDNFLILDRMTSSLFIFSNMGKFIHKIQQVGRGPNEFVELHDFFINKENNYLILNGGAKLLFFDLDTYKPIKEEKLSLNTRIVYLGDTHIHFLNNGIWNGKYNIIAKRNGHTIYQHLPISEKNVGFNYSDGFPFSQPMQGNEVFFAEIFNNTIYRLNKDSMVVSYYIDFGKDELPKRFFEEIPINERTERILNSDYYFFLSDYYKNDKLFKFTFSHGDSELSYYNFFDRREEFIFKRIIDDFYLGIAPGKKLYVENDSNYIVSFHDVYSLKEGFEHHNMLLNNLPEYEKDNSKEMKGFLKSFKNNHSIYYETLKSLANKNEEDNYVISKWYY